MNLNWSPAAAPKLMESRFTFNLNQSSFTGIDDSIGWKLLSLGKTYSKCVKIKLHNVLGLENGLVFRKWLKMQTCKIKMQTWETKIKLSTTNTHKKWIYERKH